MPIVVSLMLIAISLPMVVSIAIAALPQAKPRSVQDYFLYEEKLDADRFMQSSVAYSLQAAAIFLFIYWSFIYGFWALFIPVCWFFGYCLVYIVCKRGGFDNFLKANVTRTIHGYIGQLCGSSKFRKFLVFLISFSTVIGVGGTMVVEADYVVQWLTASLQIHEDFVGLTQKFGLYFILAFALMYVLWGGYKAVVATDEIQTPIAYMAFGLFVTISSYLAVTRMNSGWALGALVSLPLLFGALYSLRKKLLPNNEDFSWARTPLILLVGSALVGFIVLIFTQKISGLSWTNPVPVNQGDPFMGFGWIGVISLVLANSLWQFIDISSLQRLQSVRHSLTNNQGEDKEKILKAIFATGFESMMLWVLIIIAAIPLHALGASEAYAISNILLTEQNGVLGPIAIALFLFALTTFALSTIDAFVSSLSYVAYYDILGYTEKNSGKSLDAEVSPARWVTIIATVTILVGYFVLRENASQDTLPQILYAIYAVQLSILPVVVSAIFFQKVDLWAGILSVIFGWYFAFSPAISEPLFGISPHSWWVIPPLAVLCSSTITYIVVSQIRRAFLPKSSSELGGRDV